MKKSYEAPSAQMVEVHSEQIICESFRNSNVKQAIQEDWGELN